MTCKDCIHYEACEDWAIEYGDNYFPFNNCQVFKPKSRYIELPCAVGDTVWFIRNKKLIETCVEKIILKHGGLYIKLGCNSMYETSCRSFGKTVFLTKEEAEKALERSEGK